jgi:hypothetical protein
MIATLGDRKLSFGREPARQEMHWLIGHSRAPKIRTRRQFAEDELILPDGPYENFPFRVHRQPYTGLWLDACDGVSSASVDLPAVKKFRRIISTGPSQSGKSTIGTVVPTLYHLFEIGEAVGLALPDANMADVKYRKDILPSILKTRYRELLPDRGEGSEGGTVKNMVIFKNGAVLKFFTAGGSDKSRAGIPCRVLVITEANAFGSSAEASNESSKLEQLLARLLSFGTESLVYMECTVEVEDDVIWSHYKAGTESRIACPCPHCQAFVTPEREDLVGWQEATDEEEAEEKTHFQCPACTHAITDAQRRTMNADAVLLHRGQVVEAKAPTRRASEGQRFTISGDAPRTDMLGFRWNAFNNLFISTGQLGKFELEGRNATDEDAHERKMHQFIWCKPYKPAGDEQAILNANALMGRQAVGLTRGIVPADTFALTIGCDLGKRFGHFVVIAWMADGRGHVVDYGRFDIAGDELGPAVAILQALRNWRDTVVMPGFAIEGTTTRWIPDQAWVDARYQGEKAGDTAVYEFIHESERERFRPTLGFGTGKYKAEHYRRPKATSKKITAIGDGYHFEVDPANHVTVVHVNADHWKGFFQDRLLIPLQDKAGQRLHGSLTLYHTHDRKEHTVIAKHWSAEARVTEYVPGKGPVTRLKRIRKQNHLLDASSLSSSAGHFCGVRLVVAEKPQEAPPPESSDPTIQLPDGRPFFILDR